MIVERFDIERLRLCIKLMISESVSQYDIVLGIIVCPCEVEGYFRQTGGEETPDGAWSRQRTDWLRSG